MNTASTVTCIGLANVDVIANVDDAFIRQHKIEKAASTLLDACTTGSILGQLAHPVFYPGGCAANTACGIAGFDVPTRYVGKTGDDTYADIFRKGFNGYDIVFDTLPFAQKMTSTCLTLVTPDKDRSFAFCTDTAGWFLFPGDLPDIPAGSNRYVYLESNTAKMPGGNAGARSNVLLAAAEKYGDAGINVIVNLNDREIVRTARDTLYKMLTSDIKLFIGNISEAFELFGVKDRDSAFAAIKASGKTFAVTDGPGGAWIIENGRVEHIPAIALHDDQIVNTIGAGDQFAAGVVAGLALGETIADACARGIEAATAIIQQVSARPERTRKMKVIAK